MAIDPSEAAKLVATAEEEFRKLEELKAKLDAQSQDVLKRAAAIMKMDEKDLPRELDIPMDSLAPEQTEAIRKMRGKQ